MKRRILSLLLALCLVVGLLPMMVWAADEEVPIVTFNTMATADGDRVKWVTELSAGMKPAYAKTTAEGITTTVGASAADWNIKIEWVDGGTPTLTLKDAYLVNNVIVYNTSQTYQHTIRIEKLSENFIIKLQGTNTIFGGQARTSADAYNSKSANGIYAANGGTLTIQGTNKRDDSLLIDNKSGHCIVKRNNALTIKNASVRLNLATTSNNYAQHGIVMSLASSNPTPTNLLVEDSNLHISGSGSNCYSNNAIVMAGAYSSSNANYAYSDSNTGNITFKNSNIRINRNNSSTGSVQKQTVAIRHAASATFTIDNCEVYIYARHRPLSYAPTITNYVSATYEPERGKVTPFDFTPGASLANASNFNSSIYYTTIRITHECQADTPVTKTHIAACQPKEQTTTYCKICDKVLDYSETTSPIKAHTPSNKTELDFNLDNSGFQHASSGLFYTSCAQTHYKLVTGSHKFQYTCTVCGEIYTEEEPARAAMLYYATTTLSDETTNQYGTQWNDNTKKAYTYQKILNNGGSTLYFETIAQDAGEAGKTYMVTMTDATRIANNEWTIKLEYPLFGNPVLTLKGANLINCGGLWYGVFNWNDMAPLTIVLEGENFIKQPVHTTGASPLNLRTKNPVTITGSGSLTLECLGSSAAIRSLGDLNIVDTTINIVSAADNNPVDAIQVGYDQGTGTFTGADLVIKDSTVNIFGFDCKAANLSNGIVAYKNSSTGKGGNITIDNSSIKIQGTADDSKAFINAANDLTITNSDLLFAHGYASNAAGEFVDAEGKPTYEDRSSSIVTCGGTLTLNYPNGVTGKYNGSVPTQYNVTDNPATPKYPESLSDITNVSELTSALRTKSYGFYLNITTDAPSIEFDSTRIGLLEDFILEFALDTTKADDSYYAKIVRTRIDKDGMVKDDEPIIKYLSELEKVDNEKGGYYYVIPYANIAAKEIQDKISVTVCKTGANGEEIVVTKTETDSVYDYAMRMLRGDAPAGHNEAQFKALKTVLVDLLNYCTMAQIEFNFNDKDLVNKPLTVSEWAYGSTKMQETSAVAATVEGTAKHLGTTFELNNSIAMLIAVEGEATSAKVYVNGVESQEGAVITAGNGYSIITFNGLNAADGRKEVKFEVYNGETLTVTVTDSLAAYVGRNIEKYPRLANLMKYCDAAAAYFEATK